MKKTVIIALVVAMSTGGVLSAIAASAPDAGAAGVSESKGSGKPASSQETNPCGCHKHKKDTHHNGCGCRKEGRDHHGRQRHRFQEMAEELGLSDQQKTQIKDMFKKNQPATRPLVTKLMDERQALRTLIQTGNADETAIRAQAARVAGVEEDLAVRRAQMAKQMRSILTPAQIEKLKAIQKKEREHKFEGEWMGERCDDPGPAK